MSLHTFPKLHNSAWSGIVGKEDGTDHPPISLDRMLELTVNARANDRKFDGMDFMLAGHIDVTASTEDIIDFAQKVAGRGLSIGTIVAPVWPDTGGGSAMGTGEDCANFLKQVRAACTFGRILNEQSARDCNVIRIDSATNPADWAQDPDGSEKIAATFRIASKIAADSGQRLAAEGEICWGGMQSIKLVYELLMNVNGISSPTPRQTLEPGFVGFQADLAHTYLYLLGLNATQECPLLHPDHTEEELWVAYEIMTNTLRPWTIDFHIAQNDGTVEGTGSHDKTGRHCLADDPNGKLDIVKAAGYWLRGAEDRGIRHICWDGCMLPNEVLEDQKTWDTVLATMSDVREDVGWN